MNEVKNSKNMEFYENPVDEDYEFQEAQSFQRNLVFIEEFLNTFDTIPKVFIDIIKLTIKNAYNPKGSYHYS